MKHDDKINCLQCVHFAVTWEPRFPKSCRLFGFKSADLPSVAVYKNSGIVCEGFEKKQKFK